MKIKYGVDDNCVGPCPQGCIHCGRGKYIYPIAIECDICLQNCEEVYQTENENVCKDCLSVLFKRVTVEDIEENMGEYEDELWEKYDIHRKRNSKA